MTNVMNCNFCLYQDQKSVLYIRIFLMDAPLNGKMFPIEVTRCPPELWDLCLMIWRKCHLRWLMNQEWRIYKLSKVNITLSKGIESLSQTQIFWSLYLRNLMSKTFDILQTMNPVWSNNLSLKFKKFTIAVCIVKEM